MFELKTKRIGLRKFCDHDLAGFAALNADPHVMEFFPALLDEQQTRSMMNRINDHIDAYGYGLWAAEHLTSGILMGFVGIATVPYETDFTPATEIGWRLATAFWGKGYATEAAKASLEFVFDRTSLDEIVSFTACINHRSSRVMQRIGMQKTGEFEHPNIAPGHRLCRHDLYRITRIEYERGREKQNSPQ